MSLRREQALRVRAELAAVMGCFYTKKNGLFSCVSEASMSESLPLGSERAMRIIAENKLRAAIEAGEFDNLPGFGKPSPLIDEPYDPWSWIKRKLRQESLPANPADGWQR
jgi:hypothetical protein